MDLQNFINNCDSVSCIMSVEKKPDGYGDIRIVTGNQAYIDSIERNSDEASDIAKEKVFVPNSLYTKYFPEDLNFEEFCYRAAVKKEILHTYVQPPRVNFWFNLFFMPVVSDDENIGYCTYTYEITMNADTGLMSNIPLNIASNVLQTCIKLRGATDFKSAIDEVVSDIRKMCNANRCCLMLSDFSAGTCELLSDSHVVEGPLGPIENIIDESFYDIMVTWDDTLAGSDYLMIKNERDMQVLKQRNPVWYESLKQYDMKKLVLFPLRYNGETKGYIWVTDFDDENTITIRETLELTTYFIASEIANYQMVKQLEILSSIDLLTGVRNRNAMNNRVIRLTSGEDKYPDSLRVVFADMNGLKKVNDQSGHNAGDLMLKSAALALQDAFRGQEIYRAGGDEFMLIISNMDDAKFESAIKRIRSYSYTEDTGSFAIGCCNDNGRNDIREDMKEADERMYADKEEYYNRFPERRYR